jgi:hypothetical protein
MALWKAETAFRSNASRRDPDEFHLPVRLLLLPASNPSVLPNALDTRLQAEG